MKNKVVPIRERLRPAPEQTVEDQDDQAAALDLLAKRLSKPKDGRKAPQARVVPETPVPAAGGAPSASKRPSKAKNGVDAELDARIRADFKVFLTLVWEYLGLGVPSAVQFSIADYLQHGGDLSVIMAFRGVGKSWITAAFALWCLYCDNQAKVLVVSGSMKRAVQFTTFCLAIIKEMPAVKHLSPRRDQRQSSTAFDVGPARPAQSSSLSAFGITGQIVGQRANVIIPDDIETNTNSLTVTMREKLGEAVREFSAILVPGGKIKFLGTPQTIDSIYNKLAQRGYTIRIWPMVYPDAAELRRYGDTISPWIRKGAAGHAHEPVWPERFGDAQVQQQRVAWGTSGFALQFMLDTSLSDANRYPLKLANLMVMGLDDRKGPMELTWGRSDELALKDLPLMGFPGDRFYKPAYVGPTYAEYDSIYASIDTSGSGKDETAIAIGAFLGGRVFLLACAGWIDGSSSQTLHSIAKLLVKYRVSKCRIESNFGDTLFAQLLRPILTDEWEAWNKANPREHGGTELVDEKAQRMQKELRIVADMEPATEGHRIVVSTALIEQDYADVMARDEGETTVRYSLFHQYTNLTRDKDSLTHDDRLDAVNDLIGMFRDRLGINPSALLKRRQEDELDAELELEDEDEQALLGARRYKGVSVHPVGRRATGWGPGDRRN